MRAASLLLTLACAAAYRCIQRPVCRLDLSVTDRASSSQESSASDRARGAIRSTVRAVVSLAAPLLLFGLGSSPSPVLAEDSSLVVVLGSGGKTGALVVKRLTALGVPVRPTYRGAPPAASPSLPGVTADVSKIETLEGALKDASAVVFASSGSASGSGKSVDYLGLGNVASECVRLKVPRLVVISSGAVTRPDSLGYKFTNMIGGIMEYKVKGEDLLKQIYAEADPKLSYTIVRPGGLQDGTGVGASKVSLNQGDSISGEIRREDVADVVAAAALSKSIPARVVFEVYETGKSSALEGRFKPTSGFERVGGNYEEMFKGLSAGDVKI